MNGEGMKKQRLILPVFVILGLLNLPAQATLVLCSGSTCGEHFKSYSVFTKWPRGSAMPVTFENGIGIEKTVPPTVEEVLVYRKGTNGKLLKDPIETIKLLSKSDKNTCQVEHVLNKNKKMFEYNDCENLRKLVKTKVE